MAEILWQTPCPEQAGAKLVDGELPLKTELAVGALPGEDELDN